MILVIDNYDSFVYNLVQYLGELGKKTEVYRNDSLSLKEIERKKPSVQPKAKRSKYKFSDVDFQCAEWVYSLVIKVAISSKKPNFESWANSIRLMREADKLTHQDISDVFTWANSDPFWSVNILSVAKLREKFPQLQAKMNSASKQQSRTSKTSGNLEACEAFVNG